MNNAKFVAIGAVLQQILSFAVILLITRLLGADGYGEVVMLMSITNTIFCFSAQWAGPYMVRTGAVNYAKTNKIGDAFLMPILISLFILLGVSYLITHFFSKVFGDISSIPVLIIYCSAIGNFIFQMAKIGLQIQSRFLYYGLLLSLDKVILLFIFCVLIFYNQLTNIHVLWAYITGTMLAGFSGLGVGLYKKYAKRQNSFLYKDFSISVLPVSVSVFIHYFSSITFLILISKEIGSVQSIAWIGMGNVVLGVLLQPFSWLAPTLAPKLSNDVLEVDGHTRISAYLRDWFLPSVLIILWVTLCVITLILFTPILSLLLGAGFQGSGKIIALVSLLATAEVANLMLVSVVYARKLEILVMVAVFFKALPLLMGYFWGVSVEFLLILLNCGSWLAVSICLFGIRCYLHSKWVLQYIALAMTAFLSSFLVIYPDSKWYLLAMCFVFFIAVIAICRKMVNIFKLDRIQPKVKSVI